MRQSGQTNGLSLDCSSHSISTPSSGGGRASSPVLISGSMAETQPRSTPSWSDIPLDLAGLVLRHIPGYADRARFAAVCPQWRAAARELRLPRPLPLLALPDGTFYSCGFAGYKSACGSWLVFPRDDGCFLVDPFSRATMTLPALSSVRLRPTPANSKELFLKKLMLCSPNLVAAFVSLERRIQILVCQPGDSSWSVCAYNRRTGFEDMAFYQGKLYVLTCDENLLVVNISQDQSTGDPQVSRIGQVIKGDPLCTVWHKPYNAWVPGSNSVEKKLYLVELHGALLMICRKVYCRVIFNTMGAGQNEFEVFEADFELSRWVNVTNLGEDQVLFLGRKCSRAATVSQYGMLGDRIFFLDDDEVYFKGIHNVEENTSLGVYDMPPHDVNDMINHDVSSRLPSISWKRDGMHLATWLFSRD